MAEIIPDIGYHRIAKSNYDFGREIGFSCESNILNKPVPDIVHQMFGIIVSNHEVMSRIEDNRITATLDLKGLDGTAVATEFWKNPHVTADNLDILRHKVFAEFNPVVISSDSDQTDIYLGMIINFWC